MSQAEIVIYQPGDKTSKLEVRLDGETVWLNRQQLSVLFGRDIKTIGKHISNVLKEELNEVRSSVVAKFAITATDGKTYRVEHYNLDMIISIGYRVKSKRGIQFRIWANKVLKDYLLKGYAVSNRLTLIEEKLYDHDKKIEFLLDRGTLPEQGIFFDGQIFDAYKFTADLIKTAKTSLILIDNYVDETTLTLLGKRNKNVSCIIYTSNINKQLVLDINKYNQQYPEIIVKTYKRVHDRFLIIDKEKIYHIGASLKDLGKRWFAFSKIKLYPEDIIRKLDE